jgi:hypothetical protein
MVEIDFTAAQVLLKVFKVCSEQGVTVAVARLESIRTQKAFERFGLHDALPKDRVFPQRGRSRPRARKIVRGRKSRERCHSSLILIWCQRLPQLIAKVVEFCSKANSVPGSRQTAIPSSLSAAKPRVEVLGNVVVMSVSPTLAGRDATACRL